MLRSVGEPLLALFSCTMPTAPGKIGPSASPRDVLPWPSFSSTGRELTATATIKAERLQFCTCSTIPPSATARTESSSARHAHTYTYVAGQTGRSPHHHCAGQRQPPIANHHPDARTGNIQRTYSTLVGLLYSAPALARRALHRCRRTHIRCALRSLGAATPCGRCRRAVTRAPFSITCPS